MNSLMNLGDIILKGLFVLLVTCLVWSCEKSTAPPVENYIHIAHTRILDTINQVIDPRLERIDFGAFDMTLLGGDLCEESSKNISTLVYLDSIFELSSPSTLWALGNHDNANLDDVEKVTKRPRYYTTHYNGITFLVLYTQEKEDWICTISGEQLEMVRHVTDTIKESSHLVVMTHKLIWIKDHPNMKEHQGIKAYDWSCNYMIHENGWNTEIVPMLHNVQKRGIKVIALAGDIGNNVSEFEVHADDDIEYLASGSNPLKKDIKFLHFKHNLTTEELEWRFVRVDEFLSGNQSLEW